MATKATKPAIPDQEIPENTASQTKGAAPAAPDVQAEPASRSIPLLTTADIECRVQSVSKAKNGRVGAVLLLYKNARVDMKILDEVFGPMNWRRTHEVVNGNLFCNIDLWDDTKKEWVRKQDVGVESNTEKEKGQASDAFKRAGFNVGIGRELYTGPFIYVELSDNEYYSDGQNGRKEVFKCYSNVRFSVSRVSYNERREINDLVILDRFGNVRFDMNNRNAATTPGPAQGAQSAPAQARSNNTRPTAQNAASGRQGGQTQAPSTGGVCPICGGPISPAEQDYSRRKYGREACRNCQKAL